MWVIQFYFKGDPNNITARGQKYLQYFADRIDKYGDTIFNELSLTDQKLALF